MCFYSELMEYVEDNAFHEPKNNGEPIRIDIDRIFNNFADLTSIVTLSKKILLVLMFIQMVWTTRFKNDYCTIWTMNSADTLDDKGSNVSVL